jgi:hypothetical protein
MTIFRGISWKEMITRSPLGIQTPWTFSMPSTNAAYGCDSVEVAISPPFRICAAFQVSI